MSSDTPIYDELEAKWNATIYDRRICDSDWHVEHIETDPQWIAYGGENPGLPKYRYAKGGRIQQYHLDHIETMLDAFDHDCAVGRVPKKPKFKFLGRNQHHKGIL